MQLLPVPQPLALVSMIVCSSWIVGRCQSQWPAKPALVTAVPSVLVQLFSVPRNFVKAPPSGAVPELLHRYVLFTSCGSLQVVVSQWTNAPTVPVFFSH